MATRESSGGDLGDSIGFGGEGSWNMELGEGSMRTARSAMGSVFGLVLSGTFDWLRVVAGRWRRLGLRAVPESFNLLAVGSDDRSKIKCVKSNYHVTGDVIDWY